MSRYITAAAFAVALTASTNARADWLCAPSDNVEMCYDTETVQMLGDFVGTEVSIDGHEFPLIVDCVDRVFYIEVEGVEDSGPIGKQGTLPYYLCEVFYDE